jgi:hypothetical protein
LGPFIFGLRSRSEILRLYDANGIIYNSMFYHNDEPWPTRALLEPYSIELIDENESLCKATNWRTGCWGGSPGKECLNPSVKEMDGLTNISRIYPNPFNHQATIEATINNYKKNELVNFQVFDFTGKQSNLSSSFHLSDIDHNGSGHLKVNFQRNSLPPGIYLYRLTQSEIVLAAGKMMIVD